MNNVKYEIYLEKNSIINAAKISLKNRLYVPGWLLNKELHKIINLDQTRNCLQIVLAFVDGIPIGIAIDLKYSTIRYSNNFDFENNIEVHCFVRKKFRRQGIGGKLIKHLNVKNFNVFPGIKGSNIFYRKVLKSYEKD